MKLEEFVVYQMAMELGEQIWHIVGAWSGFEKQCMGSQLIRATDSVAANISEGYGRYHYKENVHFCYIARGSLFETGTWITKAHHRNLIDAETYTQLKQTINSIGKLLNGYTKSIGPKNQVKEETLNYEIKTDHLPFPNEPEMQ